MGKAAALALPGNGPQLADAIGADQITVTLNRETFNAAFGALTREHDVVGNHMAEFERAMKLSGHQAGSTMPIPGSPPGNQTRRVSAAGKKRIREAQKRRWAAAHAAGAGQGGVPTSGKVRNKGKKAPKTMTAGAAG